jgi:predicted CXXCH cytochrome family protein
VKIAILLLAAAMVPASVAATYVGSQSCKPCHASVYQRWRLTRMANVVVDPHLHPEAVLGDFSHPNPLVTFRLSDVAFVYGSKWKQRYFARRGDTYYVLPAQWDIQNRVWRPYHVGKDNDWWYAYYPEDNKDRPTGPLCDGCHSVNYDIATGRVTEWNVGCERCHGPGSEHVRQPSPANIVNPSRLDFVAANDVCIQCHSQGRPKANPIQNFYYDWAAGFIPGARLSGVWDLEEHKLGQTTFTHYPDGEARKNRMQGNDFVQSLMYRRGVTCFSCHDVHGTENPADTLKPGNALCLECHGPQSPNGPRESLEAHTHHRAGTSGSLCVNCHMPRIAPEIANVSIRGHTFRFVTPSMTRDYGIPNPCLDCHNTKTLAWAEAQLASWRNLSPWRIK